ncbi:MAG: hypothetical protein EOO03_12685 [Chitinophagaceae bacterium]|nr:MAG: hypothetical protein EOO03_12685 [Chitinophagaceae bacterium]
MQTETTISGDVAQKPLEAAKKACEEVAQVSPGNTHEMGARLQQMILNYYADVRKQAQQSFHFALGAAVAGTLFFLGAALLSILNENGAQVTLIAGSVIQVISAINFFLYGKASRQFSTFHICLERTNRYLLANTLCENLSCPVKRDVTRQGIIREILEAPMLTLDVINHGEPKEKKEATESEESRKRELNVETLLS